jgi:hypothetical protein
MESIESMEKRARAVSGASWFFLIVGIAIGLIVGFDSGYNRATAKLMQEVDGLRLLLPARHYHEHAKLEDGTRVGRLGALWYILGDGDTAVSKGFHEIIPTDTGYTATLGASNYLLDKSGKIVGGDSYPE